MHIRNKRLAVKLSEIEERTAWANELNKRYENLGFGFSEYYFGPGSDLDAAQDLIDELERLDDDQLDIYKKLTKSPTSPRIVTLANPSDDSIREFRYDLMAGLQYREVGSKRWQQTMVDDKFKLIDFIIESNVVLVE